MRCREVESLLPQYADNGLSAPQQARVARHLGTCESCRGALLVLDRSLRALNSAARETGPDLWSRFQLRAARELSYLDCRQAEELLPACLDEALEPAARGAIAGHLAACAACAAEKRLLLHSLRALEDAVPRGCPAGAGNSAAPDLWPAFAARLASTLSCREVRAALPAYLDKLLTGTRSTGILYHLQHCAVCAAEEAALKRSLQALERAAAGPIVDLWPAFAVRLEQEPDRSFRPGWQAAPSRLAAGRVRALLKRPLLQPVFGIAMALGAALSLTLIGRPPAPTSGRTASASRSAVSVVPAEKPESSSREEQASGAPRASGTSLRRARSRRAEALYRRAGGRSARSRRVRHGRSAASRTIPALAHSLEPAALRARESGGRRLVSSAATASGRRTRRVPGRLRIAYHRAPIVSETTAAPIDPQDAKRAEREVMPEVVHAVELLAGIQDAANRPFETPSHVQ